MPEAPRHPQSLLVACMLPWTDRFELDAARFDEHLQDAIDAGYKDVYLMGTAGEGYALGDGQFQEVVSLFAHKMLKRDARPQVGIISLSMRQVIDRIGFCRDLGIRMFQISLPSWGALNEREMMTFFKGVCGSYPDCRFLHYNLARAKVLLDGKLYRRIADATPNLVATKNSTSDGARVADLMHHAPDLQHFFLESSFALGCLEGECSLLCSHGLLFPKSTRAFFEAGRIKDWPAIWKFHRQFATLNANILEQVGTGRIDGAYDKAFYHLKNARFPTRLLPPYEGLSESEIELVRAACEKYRSDLS